MTLALTDQARADFLAILDEAHDLTLATNRADGFPQATVVSFVHDDGGILFACGPASQKARNLARDDRVSVTITAPYEDWAHIRGVSMAARAVPVRAEADRRHMLDLVLKRFPEAEGFAEDESAMQMSVFRLEPEILSLLDYRKGFGHTELFEASPNALTA